MPEMKSPLARLVVFMVFLSVAGAFVAGVQYLAIEKPLQDAVKPPLNDYDYNCIDYCQNEYSSCLRSKWTTEEECQSDRWKCSMGCYVPHW